MDFTTIVGIILGVGGIIVGNFIEGGTAASLVQGTAFLIVFGGTIGAVLVSNQFSDIRRSFSLLSLCFKVEDEQEKRQIHKEVVEAARIARKDSVLGIEKTIKNMKSEYLKIVLRYVIDGIDTKTLRDVFEGEIVHEENKMLSAAKVWNDAGGFAPTIGIIGAVLGLIHVMNHLSDTSQLGKGIAVAFVATIYGVGSANLIFLPIANKMRRKIAAFSENKILVLEGAISIINGQSPYIIEEKMRIYSEVQPTTVEEII